jgi:hypothetical protein
VEKTGKQQQNSIKRNQNRKKKIRNNKQWNKNRRRKDKNTRYTIPYNTRLDLLSGKRKRRTKGRNTNKKILLGEASRIFHLLGFQAPILLEVKVLFR